VKNGEIIFIDVPQSLAEEMKALSEKDEEMGFTVDPSIPLPVELDTDLTNSTKYENLAEKLSWEMILSGMIQVVSAGRKPSEDSPVFEGVKPHWIDYYRRFVLTLKPEIYDEFTMAAIVKARNDDFDEALEIITALEGLFPFSPEVLLNKVLIMEDKAMNLEKTGHDIEAEKVNDKVLGIYQKALAVEPVLPELMFSAGFFFFRRKEYAQAREYFSQYISLMEDFSDFQSAESSVEGPGNEKNAEKKKKAEAIVKEIESQGLDDYRFLEALDLIRRGAEDEALYIIRDFLEEHSQVSNAWFVLGWALRKLGRWEDALGSYKKAFELGSAGCDIRNEIAICLMELGKLNEAKKELEAALWEEPENIKIISNLGVLALRKKRPDEAAAFFRTVLELNPQDPLALDFFEKSSK